MSVPTPPHILTLTNDDEHDPDAPLFWSSAQLACPHDPPTVTMPCAVLDVCGCAPIGAEEDEGEGPCPVSPNGVHSYSDWDDQPQCPKAECWAVDHADDLDEAAWDLELGPGRHDVWPVCDDPPRLVLLLTDPEAVRAAKATEEAQGVEVDQ